MNKKMFAKTTAMLLAAAVFASGIPANETEAAKKPKLSKTKISVRVGASKKVTIKNAKKIKCKMKAKAKKVVKITKKSAKGLTVKGLKAGKAKITALNAALIATSVFPYPTSPHKSLSIGL